MKTKKLYFVMLCLWTLFQIQAYGLTAPASDFDVSGGVLIGYHGAGGAGVIPGNLGI